MATKKSKITVQEYGFGQMPEGLTDIQRQVLEGRRAPTSVQDVTPLTPADYRTLPNAPEWVRNEPLSPFTQPYITSGHWNNDGTYTDPQTYIGPNYSGHNWAGQVPYETNMNMLTADGQPYQRTDQGTYRINTNKRYQNGGKAQYGYEIPPIEPITVYGQRGPQMQWQNTQPQPIPYEPIQAQPMQNRPYVPPQMNRMETAQANIPYEPIQMPQQVQMPQMEIGSNMQAPSSGGRGFSNPFQGQGINIGAGIASLTSLAASLAQDNANRNKLRAYENFNYDPNSFGNGSQILFEDGGTVSQSKAKEILKDGKSNNKKLTKKQKDYFGWIAGGKAEMGTQMPQYQLGQEIDLPQEQIDYLISLGYEFE